VVLQFLEINDDEDEQIIVACRRNDYQKLEENIEETKKSSISETNIVPMKNCAWNLSTSKQPS